MGDLIDKADILDAAASKNLEAGEQRYEAEYRKLYSQSPETFKKIDELISEIAADPGKLKENGKKVWDLLPQGAHPNGYYMSRTIVDNLGNDVLIREMVNPFAFFRLYTRAAARARKRSGDDHYVFSATTTNFLRGFEKRYVRK